MKDKEKLKEDVCSAFDWRQNESGLDGTKQKKIIQDLIDRQPTEQAAQITIGMVEMLMGVCKTISECKKCPDKQCSKMLKIIKRIFGIKADG